MRPEKVSHDSRHDSRPPQSRQDLPAWVHEHLRLPVSLERDLLGAIDAVFTRHEQLWQESKQEAIQALLEGFSTKMDKLTHELHAKDVTVSSISRYFEQLVADLTDKSNRDPKTKLMNFGRFNEQLESFLALEQRGRWCAVGLVDIAGFKWYNDALGHSVGDQIIERVAQLLRDEARADDLVAQEGGALKSVSPNGDADRRELHARLGGDEFCFLVPDLAECRQAHAIAERFRGAVERFDWQTEDPRLDVQPVRVDVGVVCLALGRVADRRFIARRLAASLVQRADQLMYEAKGERANHIYLEALKIENGELAAMKDEEIGDLSWTTGIEPAAS
jgi:GGDEF domain-containing protein